MHYEKPCEERDEEVVVELKETKNIECAPKGRTKNINLKLPYAVWAEVAKKGLDDEKHRVDVIIDIIKEYFEKK
jgi:hypothetical protein